MKGETKAECPVEYPEDYGIPTMPSTRKVMAKILKLRDKVPEIHASKMKTAKMSYNYLSEQALTSALRPAMQELGLIMLPTMMFEDTEVQELSDGKTVLLSRIRATYEITDVESGESILIATVGAGADSNDKGINKALTCAFKNALRAIGMYPSPDRDDPDTVASDDSPRTSNKGKADIGDLLIKYGDHKGKTLRQLLDENPEALEEMANGSSKFLADKATEFLNSIKA